MGQVSGNHVRVDNLGGTLYVDAELEGGRVTSLYLTGPATVVCRGWVETK